MGPESKEKGEGQRDRGSLKTLRREKETEWTQKEAVCNGSGSVPEPLKEKGGLKVSFHS